MECWLTWTAWCGHQPKALLIAKETWQMRPCWKVKSAVSSNSNLVNYHLHILLSITNKMQCYTIFFITVNALHVHMCGEVCRLKSTYLSTQDNTQNKWTYAAA
jgi:hypothetical protein